MIHQVKSALTISKATDQYNAAVAAAVTLLSTVLGPQWYLFAAFFVLTVFDWMTGWYKARQLKTESSTAGLVGVVKKLWYWVIIALAFLLAAVLTRLGSYFLNLDLHFLRLIGWFTLACLSVNEARSVCENLVEAGIPVPTVLTTGLAISQKLLDQKINLSVNKMDNPSHQNPQDDKSVLD